MTKKPNTVPGWCPVLLAWFYTHKRALPWRDHPEPYRVWVSEIMLQQTRVATVEPYFKRFIARFPTIDALAQAPLHSVLKVWEGLGYYSRARNLHKAARKLVRDHHGKLPSDVKALRKLPGIGEYTAGAVASIAFNRPEPAIDGNVLRVLARLKAEKRNVRSSQVRCDFSRLVRYALLAIQDRSAFNQGLMELGAGICTPQKPACPLCPVQDWCQAFKLGLTTTLPARPRRKPVPQYTIAVGLVLHEGRILIAQRSPEQMLGGLWEFPGGKKEPGESLEQTVLREVHEEVGIEVEAEKKLCTVKHAYSHFRITLTAFLCRYVSGTVTETHTDQPIRWVHPEELHEYPFPRANQKIIEALLQQPQGST